MSKKYIYRRILLKANPKFTNMETFYCFENFWKHYGMHISLQEFHVSKKQDNDLHSTIW